MVLNKWIGDKQFYKMALAVALPLMVQQVIAQFVSLLDNVMIGQVGTLAMSAVSVANQLLFVINLAIIGSVNAAGIFSAQYYGKKDKEGLQQCFRFKIYVSIIFVSIGIFALLVFGRDLLNLYMDTENNTPQQIEITMNYALSYVHIMCIGLIPYAISTALSASIRDSSKTVIPMIGSSCGFFVNLCLNYVLIFGHFGFPRLEVAGAAIATVIARFIEFFVMLIGTLKHRKDYCYYVVGAFNKFDVSLDLVRRIIIKGTPLVCNEVLWSMGLAAITQRYSSRGLDTIAAVNIADTISKLFSMSAMGIGNATALLLGQKLGAGKVEEAKDIDNKMLVFTILLNFIFVIALYICSPYLPLIYKTEQQVADTATILLKITALLLPVGAIYSVAYYTLRAGGKTIITFLFDSGYTCTISLLTATIVTVFTNFNIVEIYLCVKLMDIPKAIIGLVLMHKGVWIHNLVG